MNRILKREEIPYPVTYYEENQFHIIVMNGNDILDKVSFFKTIESGMQFPKSCNNKFSRFDDWMTDLSWFPSETGICIIINNYSKFLSMDTIFKENLMNDFSVNILPFWEEKVLHCVKEGKKRRFDIILN